MELWNPELVGDALVGAFVTLDRLPATGGPRRPGGNWPQPMTEWADQLAQAELEESERAARQQAANRIIVLPSSEDITRMEMAFEWLRQLRIADSGMAMVVTHWALRAARGRSMRQLCKEKHWSPATFYRVRQNGLAYLVKLLNTWGVRVFEAREA